MFSVGIGQGHSDLKRTSLTFQSEGAIVVEKITGDHKF